VDIAQNLRQDLHCSGASPEVKPVTIAIGFAASVGLLHLPGDMRVTERELLNSRLNGAHLLSGGR